MTIVAVATVLVVLVPTIYCNHGSEKEDYKKLRYEFDQGNDDFTASFLKDVIEESPHTSIISSPFSVEFLLSQLALYAKGTSYKELRHLLNLRSRQGIRTLIPRYLDEINSQRGVNFSLVGRVYGSDNYPFSKEFKHDTHHIFHAQAENLDFDDPKKAAHTINAWVASQTNDLIKNLVSPSSFNKDTRLVLTNAIYFKGNWRTPFNPKKTQKREFFVSHKRKTSVEMMNQIGHFKYGHLDNIKAKAVQMFYKNDNFSFVCILPDNKEGVKALAKKLQEFDLHKDIVSSLDSTRVDISIPVIHTETTTDLVDILKKNGVKAIFDYNNSDLSGILKYQEPLYVSSATQKAKIIVNEAGSEAAAANDAVISTRAALPNVENLEMFNANHPFLYYILYDHTPIFAGLYRS